MLHLPFKTTEKVDLTKPLYKFVEIAYSAEQADEHRDAFHEVSALRERVRERVQQPASTEQSAAETTRLLLRYYRVLAAMRTRFGAVVEDAEAWATFAWSDAVRPSEKKAARPELNHEMACVLFNLAAALSYSATVEDRATPAGLRAACQAFQYAAGALDLLAALPGGGGGGGEEGAAGAAAPPAPPGTADLHPRSVAGWRSMMLAQAQQCFYQKACADRLKPSVVAKLAQQARPSRRGHRMHGATGMAPWPCLTGMPRVRIARAGGRVLRGGGGVAAARRAQGGARQGVAGHPRRAGRHLPRVGAGDCMLH